MLVYGDAVREISPRECLDLVARCLAHAAAAETGIERHGLLVAALIEAGELAQGLADTAFASRGEVDEVDPLDEAAAALTVAVARQVVRSWRSGFREAAGEDLSAARALADLSGRDLPGRITARQPEGFGFYALYPEAYAELAATLPADTPLLVLGLRSIGTTLAACAVAGAAGSAASATVRPTGPPFERRIGVGPGFARRLSDHREATVAVVDEGPGLSGSSCAAAIRLVERHGVPSGRIQVWPSHEGGPGPHGSAAIRSAWGRVGRRTLTFDDLVLNAPEPAHRLVTWVRDLVGDPLEPMREISGGAWRAVRPGWERAPVHAAGERRKFLLRTAGGAWLIRFAGLGQEGMRKAEMARTLADGGFTPALAGFRHGFLVERWIETARPVDPAADRAGLLDHLGRYLAVRADALGPPPRRGASGRELYGMARRNAALALGDAATARLARWEPLLDGLDRVARPVPIDGRLHGWEWLRTERGLLKADAVDHHCSHDLVGPQDIAWDVAGAAAEFGLTGADRDRLAALVSAAIGQDVDRRLLAFMGVCYAAFQLGAWTLAEAAAAETERATLAGEVARYRRNLVICLEPDIV